MSVEIDPGLGLHLLYPLEGTTNVKTTFDIIAIHGLGGGSLKSWRGKSANASGSGPIWIRDFLPQPQCFPQARIFTFGYDSEASFVGSSVATVRDAARSLLLQMQDMRDGSHPNRPILFICHSLGGILLKKALLLASDTRRENNYLVDPATPKGVVFMGTPHYGSSVASTLGLFAKLSLSKNTRQNVRLLSNHSPELEELSERFVKLANEVRFIISVYETRKNPLTNTLIVNTHSSLMKLDHEIPMPSTSDHNFMCKFDGPGDKNYAMLVGQLRRSIREHFSGATGTVEAPPSSVSRPPSLPTRPSTYSSDNSLVPEPGPYMTRPSSGRGSPGYPSLAISHRGSGSRSPYQSPAPSIISTPASFSNLPAAPQPAGVSMGLATTSTSSARVQLVEGIESSGPDNERIDRWLQTTQTQTLGHYSPWGDDVSRQLGQAQTLYENGDYKKAFNLYKNMSERLKNAGVAATAGPGDVQTGGPSPPNSTYIINTKRLFVYDRLARCCLQMYEHGRDGSLALAPLGTDVRRQYAAIEPQQRRNIEIGRGSSQKSRALVVGTTSIDHYMVLTTEIALRIAKAELEGNIQPGEWLGPPAIMYFARELGFVEEELGKLWGDDGGRVKDIVDDIYGIKRKKLNLGDSRTE